MVCVAVLAATLGAVCGEGSARAATTQSAGWDVISAGVAPSQPGQGENASCEAEGLCDSYAIAVMNAGAKATNGSAVTIKDRLPEGIRVHSVETLGGNGRVSGGFDWMGESAFPCEAAETEGRSVVTCTVEQSVPGGDILEVDVEIVVDRSEAYTGSNEVIVEGGGTAAASATDETGFNERGEAAFGIASFALHVDGTNGVSDTQAGDHPNVVVSSVVFNTRVKTVLTSESVGASGPYEAVEEPRDISVRLPLGLVGDPRVASRCPIRDLAGTKPGETKCPSASQIGFVMLDKEGETNGSITARQAEKSNITPLYNMVPERGFPAEFGFAYFGNELMLYPAVERGKQGYMLVMTARGIPRVSTGLPATINGFTLVLFGDPTQHAGLSSEESALFSNPPACSAGPLDAELLADSWQHPGAWVQEVSSVYPSVGGCGLITDFAPGMEVKPDSVAADTPAGYQVSVTVPQAPNVWPTPAAPDVRTATVTLPQGVSLSPAAGQGLLGCAAEGPEGINVGSGDLGPEGQDLKDPEATELGASYLPGNHSGYGDGLYHSAPGHCPAKSQIGTVEVKTPLLSEPLHGHVYLAQPQCGGSGQPECTPQDAEDGKLYAIYLEIGSFKESGVIIKLKGNVDVNAQTGQMITTFEENPQLPFEELKLNFSGGQRAPLANPQSCGTYTTTSLLEPWSHEPGPGEAQGTPDATPSSSFEVEGCKSPMPFAPSFEAGTEKPLGGEFSPFVLTLKREDGEQDLAGVSITMPPGVSAMLSEVPLCEEPQASAGSCSEASRVGTVHVAAGSGSEPLWLEGPVYLTGPYEGDPFGLSVVVPAKAGPFNLGDEVVRSGISVNQSTAQVSVSTQGIPQSRDGIPFRLKEMSVEINRPGFMFNPTNCEQLQVTGTVSGDLANGSAGSTVPVSSPFADTGCRNLAFKPAFTVASSAKTSRADGASLITKIRFPQSTIGSEADLRYVKVTLPKLLPSRESTLKDACTEEVFAEDPAHCPAGSLVGTAVTHTPVLPVPLEGPVYFVSHGVKAYPELTMVMQGDGVSIVLAGETHISKAGITTTTFHAVPDVPFSSFELKLPSGPHSALGANGSLCHRTFVTKKRVRLIRHGHFVKRHGRYVYRVKRIRHVVHRRLVMPTILIAQNGREIRQQTVIKVAGCGRIAAVHHGTGTHRADHAKGRRHGAM